MNHPRTSESLPPDYNLPHPQNPGTYSNQRQSRIRVIRHDDLVGSGIVFITFFVLQFVNQNFLPSYLSLINSHFQIDLSELFYV